MNEKLRAPQTYGPGDTFAGKFRIISMIGSGGFGSVFKAHDINLSRDVALKILHSWVLADSDNRARFIREAKILTDLHDANIVHVHSFGIDDTGRCYMSMEFLQGKTLAECVQGSRALEWREAARIGVQICHAAGVAHQHGIVHRDLKPENIMLVASSNGPLVKVLDFGLCGLLPDGPQELQRLTQTGAVMGSAHYMSPEVCMGLKADQRSDVYSVGCVMYECLSGRKPVATDDAIAVMYAQTKELPSRLNTPQQETVPLDLELSVFKAIQKDADERFQSMTDFGDALSAVLQGDRPLAIKPESIKLSSARHQPITLPPRRKFHPALMWTALAVFVCSGIAVYFMGSMRQTSDLLFLKASSVFRRAANPALPANERNEQYSRAADMFSEALLRAPQNWRFYDDARLQRLLCYARGEQRQKIRDDALDLIRDFNPTTSPWSDTKYEANHQLAITNIDDKRYLDACHFGRNAVGYTIKHQSSDNVPMQIEALLDRGEAYWYDHRINDASDNFIAALTLTPPFSREYATRLRMSSLRTRLPYPEASGNNAATSSYNHEDLARDTEKDNLRRAIADKLLLSKAYLGLTTPSLPENKELGAKHLAELMQLYSARDIVPQYKEIEELFVKYGGRYKTPGAVSKPEQQDSK